MAAVLAEFLAGALGSVTTKVFVFPFETVRVVLAVRKEDYKVRSLLLATGQALHTARRSSTHTNSKAAVSRGTWSRR